MPSGYRTVIPAPREVVLEPQDVGDPGAGELLLQTRCTLISTGTELTALAGDFPPNSRWSEYIHYPVTVGYSSVASVAQVGEGVSGFEVGDRVASLAPHASYALFPAEAAWRIPEGVDDDAASFSTLAEIALGGVRRSRLVLGESVAIVGAGLVGLLTAQFCRLAGAWPVVIIDPAPRRAASATALGFQHVITATAAEAHAELPRLMGGQMADVVFEITGSQHAIPGAIRLARPLGRVVLLGSPRGPVNIDFHDEVHSAGLELIGAHNRTHPPVATLQNPWTMARHVQLFLEWQQAGVVDVRPLVTHRFSWRQAPEAYYLLLEDRAQALGVVLDWTAA